MHVNNEREDDFGKWGAFLAVCVYVGVCLKKATYTTYTDLGFWGFGEVDNDTFG